MDRLKAKKLTAKRRAHRVRIKLFGTAQRPRLTVYISNLHVTAQVVDDSSGKTVAYASSVGKKAGGTMVEKATLVGQEVAIKAKKAGLSQVVFDRGSRKYHGRVKALADAAREKGLEF